jgi:transaldolase
MTRLQDLYTGFGQSPWLDNLRRDWLTDGQLAGRVADGVRGITSNPTILAKAIESEDAYDEQFASLAGSHGPEEIYWELVIRDITDALAMLRPVHDESGGTDGFVSVEVAPSLARDTRATIDSAHHLHDRIAQPNLMVKVPATAEGVPAIRALIGAGRTINITLIFGLERYDAVMEAYLGGLEDRVAGGAGDLSEIHSVASFFVSRVDTEVDRRLEDLAGGPEGDPAVLDLRGRAAVAQARAAYGRYTDVFTSPRWERLAGLGAHVQRPLWASTSTKNAAYPDLLYVDGLIGPDTVNTMPEGTLDAFDDHGRLARTVDEEGSDHAAVLQSLADVGIDLEDVARTLEDQGVDSFALSFDGLMKILADKAEGAR